MDLLSLFGLLKPIEVSGKESHFLQSYFYRLNAEDRPRAYHLLKNRTMSIKDGNYFLRVLTRCHRFIQREEDYAKKLERLDLLREAFHLTREGTEMRCLIALLFNDWKSCNSPELDGAPGLYNDIAELGPIQPEAEDLVIPEGEGCEHC